MGPLFAGPPTLVGAFLWDLLLLGVLVVALCLAWWGE